MRYLVNILLLLAATYVVVAPLMSQPMFPPLVVEEVDGSPSLPPVILKVTNGSLTDNGDGTATISTTGATTLDQAFDGGKIIDGANSQANAMCVGDGTDEICMYCVSGVCTIEGPSGDPLQLKANTTLHTAATATIDPADCTNHVHYNNDADAVDFTLCSPAGGETICFHDEAGGVITVDTADAGDTIVLDGTALTAGNAIDSPGSRGDRVCLEAKDANTWVMAGRLGTWVDGGAD